MQFLEFKQHFTKYLVFSVTEIKKEFPNFNKMNLPAWQKKGYLRKIRNSWYCFTDIEIDETVLFYIANKIYQPSYVSLETALSFYGIIPEGVFSITSVTTLKTQNFNTNTVINTYSNIKKECFFGYNLVQKQNYTYKIANPEKTLSDYLYLRTSVKTTEDIKSLRFNKQQLRENINLQKMFDYALIFNSKTLFKKIEILKKYINA